MRTQQNNNDSQRTEQINQALSVAYANASNLKISKAEAKALMKPFPDTVIEIRPLDGLIFIPHIFLSDRMNHVFNPGAWSLICRRYWPDAKRNMLCAEHVLIIRGCVVGEAMGEHYFKCQNSDTRLGDALESTAAEALRRIVGKRLSCGNEIWQPDYCEKWRKKFASTQRGSSGEIIWFKKGSTRTLDSEIELPPGISEPKPRKLKRKKATEDDRHVMLQCLSTLGADKVLAYAIAKGIIKPDQTLVDWPLDKTTTSEIELRALQAEIQGSIKQETSNADWKLFPMPFGKRKGTPLGKLDRETIAAFWDDFKVLDVLNGMAVPPDMLARDKAFRVALDQAGIALNFSKLKRKK